MTVIKTHLIEVQGRVDLCIGYRDMVKKLPLQIEECHGRHLIDNSERHIDIDYVELQICGAGFVIEKENLSHKQKEALKDLIP